MILVNILSASSYLFFLHKVERVGNQPVYQNTFSGRSSVLESAFSNSLTLDLPRSTHILYCHLRSPHTPHRRPMDPSTISTGTRVSGYLSLAIDLINILREYTTTVKSAPSDAETLLTGVISLNQVLQQLTNFLEKPEHNANFYETSVLCSVVTICDTKIRNLHSKLNKFRSAEGMRDRRQWPFEKQECLDTVQTLHHCAQTIEFSLTISNGYLDSR